MPKAEAKSGVSVGNDVTEFLTYRIHRLNYAMDAQAIAILGAKSSLNQVQWRVLSPIVLGLASTARDLVEKTNMDPATSSRGVRELDLAGLIRTERSEADRRKVLLHATDAGRKTVEAVLPHMKARQRRLLYALDAAEREVVFKILDKLQATVEATLEDL